MADSLVVVPSGATSFDLDGRVKGTLDLPLCKEGWEEARLSAAVAARHDPTWIVSSPSRCAMETAGILGSRLRLRVRSSPSLTNLDHGLWTGLTVEEMRRRRPRVHRLWQEQPWGITPPGGETLESACDRVREELERLVRKSPAGCLALVVPDPLTRLVGWVAAGRPLGDLWRRPAADGGSGAGERVFWLPLGVQWAEQAGAIYNPGPASLSIRRAETMDAWKSPG
jgi:broad specificity phosphatase PhoE